MNIESILYYFFVGFLSFGNFIIEDRIFKDSSNLRTDLLKKLAYPNSSKHFSKENIDRKEHILCELERIEYRFL